MVESYIARPTTGARDDWYTWNSMSKVFMEEKKKMDERNKHWKDDTMKGGHYKTTTKFTF
jgi:hypothetical protein